MPVSDGDALELVVASVVGADVLATVTLVESVFVEAEVDVELLVGLCEVVVSGAILEVIVARNDEGVGVEKVLEAPDGDAVVSGAELDTG